MRDIPRRTSPTNAAKPRSSLPYLLSGAAVWLLAALIAFERPESVHLGGMVLLLLAGLGGIVAGIAVRARSELDVAVHSIFEQLTPHSTSDDVADRFEAHMKQITEMRTGFGRMQRRLGQVAERIDGPEVREAFSALDRIRKALQPVRKVRHITTPTGVVSTADPRPLGEVIEALNDGTLRADQRRVLNAEREKTGQPQELPAEVVASLRARGYDVVPAADLDQGTARLLRNRGILPGGPMENAAPGFEPEE